VQFLQGLSLAQLVESILRELALSLSPTAPTLPAAHDGLTELDPQRLDELKEGELDSLLNTLLQTNGNP
jgi:hypothetical protein